MINKLEKLLGASTLIFLITLFIFMTHQNFILSESWSILTLRQVDDFALLSSVDKYYDFIRNGQYVSALGFFDYAYGNIFWMLNALLLLPFHLIGNEQAQIVGGREITTIFAFGCLFLQSKIIECFTKDKIFKYLIIIITATMPIFFIWAMRFHVNFQFTFFGLTAFFLLLKPEKLTHKDIILSAIFSGIMVGFKMTGIFLVPLIGLTLIWRCIQDKNINTKKEVITFAVVAGLTGIISTAPIFIVSPFYLSESINIFKTIYRYKNLGVVDEISSFYILLTEGIGISYLSSYSLIFLGFLASLWSYFEYRKQRNPIPFFLTITVVLAIFLLTFVIKKAPYFSAAYFIGVGMLMPLAYLGLLNIPIKKAYIYIILITLLCGDLYINNEKRESQAFLYYDMVKREYIIKQVKALSELKKIIPEPTTKVSILRDYSVVTPLTRFNKNVDEAINYWNLESKKNRDFDYILLNDIKYYNSKDKELEKENRKILKEKGVFAEGSKYELIFDKYDIEAYKKVKSNEEK